MRKPITSSYYFQFWRVKALLQEGLHLVVDVLTGESELLVEHLVGSRETEALESPDGTVGTYQAFEVDGQTGGQSELLLACGQHALLVLLRLRAEKSLGGNADHAGLDAVGSQQLGTSLEGGNLRTGSEEDDIVVLSRAGDDVGTLGGLAVVVALGQHLDVLTREDESGRRDRKSVV